MAEEELDKSKNTHTNEELKEILAQHKLWLDTKGKEGEKADVSGAVLMRADLEGANLMRANLKGADLEGANLRWANLRWANLRWADLEGADLEGADLMEADLMGADLRGADLRGARFEKDQLKNTINWRHAIGVSPELITLQPTELQEKQNQIQRLEQELQQAKQEIEKDKENITKDSENSEIIKRLETELTQAKKDKEELENKLQEKLNTEIKNAQKALANSLKNADDRIKEHSETALTIQKLAKNLLYAVLVVLLIVFIVIFGLILCGNENFNSLLEKLNAWSLILFNFPIIIMLTIAITLFRHQKKLLDEVRHYSADKRQIELYSGLLEASQHAATGLNDPQKSAEYVHETFTAIRDRILNEPTHANTAGSAVEKEGYENVVSQVADTITKNKA